MPIYYILLALSLSLVIWFVMKPLKKKKESQKTRQNNQDNTNPRPKNFSDLDSKNSDITNEVIEPEMPEKPLPVNCQLAQFQPAPQDFFYVDCCGVPQKGQGFEPWEKRSPVAIDSNKPFIGMTLLDVESEINC